VENQKEAPADRRAARGEKHGDPERGPSPDVVIGIIRPVAGRRRRAITSATRADVHHGLRVAPASKEMRSHGLGSVWLEENLSQHLQTCKNYLTFFQQSL
jgi:hypothetical protein